MGRYHGTGRLVGKAGRSLIVGPEHTLLCQSSVRLVQALGNRLI